jgi:ATP-dependent RNA helicase DbpA
MEDVATMTTFSTLALRPPLLAALSQIGYAEMTEIQAAALPLLLKKHDIVGQAKTGSGKTAAFGLSILQSLEINQPGPQSLVLCPTRELADQVASEIRRLASQLPNTRVLVLCGGRPFYHQTQRLKHGASVVVGTPGRLLKHIDKETLDLSHITTLVLDEADRMLDMGFSEDVLRIIKHTPETRQTLLFSATWPAGTQKLSAAVQKKPQKVSVASVVSETQLQQRVYTCEKDERDELLVNLLAEYAPTKTLVFCERKHQCDEVARLLNQRGGRAMALHGDLEQRDRDEVLVQFSNGSTAIVVATNVAARGLDIDELDLVISYEVSPEPEVHIHRVGRTGRADHHGMALSLVASGPERRRLHAIEQLMGLTIEKGSPPPPAHDLKSLSATHRTLMIFGGRKDKLRPGDILGALTGEGGLEGADIGRIQVLDNRAYVAITRSVAREVFKSLHLGKIKGKRFRLMWLG